MCIAKLVGFAVGASEIRELMRNDRFSQANGRFVALSSLAGIQLVYRMESSRRYCSDTWSISFWQACQPALVNPPVMARDIFQCDKDDSQKYSFGK
jgi:hypothetical protein